MGIKALTAACVAAVAMAGSAGAADVLFSSIPDLTAAPANVWNLTSPTTVAGQFTISSDTQNVGFEIADKSTDTSITIDIFADNNGAPGEVLYGGRFDQNLVSYANTHNGTRIVSGPLQWLPTSGIKLSAGTYWLGISSVFGTTETLGRFNGSNPTLLCMDPGTVCSPDPDSIGFAVLSYPPVVAVPEPATWAMMLLGVGLMGAALRRRPALALNGRC